MSKDNAYVMLRSNDHSNVHICVREMLYPAKSYLDLAFLIPEKPPPGGWSNWLMPKFVIFFDNISDSMGAAKFLRARLPPELQHMVKWFNANMSAEFREVEGLKLKDGDIWGLCCTDSFGMVSVHIHINFLTNHHASGSGLARHRARHSMASLV